MLTREGGSKLKPSKFDPATGTAEAKTPRREGFKSFKSEKTKMAPADIPVTWMFSSSMW